MSDTAVQVAEGKLKGKICQTENKVQYFSFKGIPYAKPPVGELRFKAPEPPESWQDIKDATKPCNIAPQLDNLTNTVVGDEDCLYLNVYSPKLPPTDGLLPVMVFFHGGGFVNGNGTDEKAHGPEYLIEKNVLLVGVNYRLGVLGFLNLDRKEAPGNMGLKDQVQALKWVQKNIAKFGGDPKNVTIFGISAGGASVEYLMLSPLAKGLFHKALAQSGTTLLHWAHANNLKELASKIPELKGKKITNEDELYKYLKDLPVKDLITTSLAAMKVTKKGNNISFGFVPSVENPGDWDAFIDKPPYVLLKQGQFAKVPFLSGFTSREGLLMLRLGAEEFKNLVKDKDFVNYLPFELDEVDKTKLTNKLKSLYLEGKTLEDPTDFAVDFFTDVDFLGGIYVATSLIAQKNTPVYFYEFAYDGGLNYLKKKLYLNNKGACHGDDGGYLLTCELLASVTLTDTDKLVRERMVTMWTNFAKHGDPTPKTNDIFPTKWSNVTEGGLQYLEISDTLAMKENLHPERMKLYQQLYDKYYGEA